MERTTIIGVDLAKNVFQVHGAAADGTVLFRKKLTRLQFHRFMAEQPACLVAMEACAGAHYWAREMRRIGHEVRLIAPESSCNRNYQRRMPRFFASGGGDGMDAALPRRHR